MTSKALRIQGPRWLSVWALLTHSASAQTPLQVTELRTEYQLNPVGIDVRAPRLSWKIESSRRGTVQTAYQIRVAQLPSALERHPLWDSGKVASDASIHRVYGGPALESGQRYYWQVRVWDDGGIGRAAGRGRGAVMG